MEVNRKPNTNCDLCNKEIYRRPSTLLINNGKFCSRSCRNKVYTDQCKGENKLKGLKMEKNPAWKGGITHKRCHGNYLGEILVRCPEEYKEMSRKSGYISEHRLIMSINIGRLLTKDEVVHHIDHNPKNNNIENLMLFKNNREHKIYEGLESKIINGSGSTGCAAVEEDMNYIGIDLDENYCKISEKRITYWKNK